jgi:hypothetical protein
MTTKYIVNNVPNQTINGDITINGNLSVTGVTTGNLSSYKALLTQTGNITGTNLINFNYGLIIGETYTIISGQTGDDFSNIANVQSGVINETGCVFIATGNTPSNWNNGSELSSTGGLIVDVLENNLGYDIFWGQFGPGTYVGFPNNIGPKYNNYPREKTSVLSQLTVTSPPFGQSIQFYAGSGSFGTKDDVLVLGVWDSVSETSVDNKLFYTPYEVKIKEDLDTTPVVISGTVISSYPFSYASIDLICGINYVQDFVGDNVTVNNISELIAELNTNTETSYLGTYSDPGDGGVLLTIPTNLVNRFCSNGTLTFEVFAD